MTTNPAPSEQPITNELAYAALVDAVQQRIMAQRIRLNRKQQAGKLSRN